MTREQAVLATLIVYKVVLLALGWLASKQTRDGEDYFLAGRKLGPWVAALSASASSSSVWTLLGVSGAAYATGLGAFWLFPACVGGFAINWFILAEPLRRQSRHSQAITITDFLAGEPGSPLRRPIGICGGLIVVFSLATYVAAQFQGAGKTFSETFGMNQTEAVFLGATIVVVYTLMGGFLAVSWTDTLQGGLMALTAAILPLAALWKVGGPVTMWQKMQLVEVAGYTSLFGVSAGWAAVGFALGFLGIGLGYPGQPHVTNRFMAMENAEGVKLGRWVALVWGLIVYSGMLVVGWCGRILIEVDDKEKIFLALTNELFPPVVAGVMIAAVLSAIMSTADSQLLVVVSALTHDMFLDQPGAEEKLLARSRVVILGVSLFAVWAALYGPPEIFGFVLFAWGALAAAFGPQLLIRVFGGRIRPAFLLASMVLGFLSAILIYDPRLGLEATWMKRCLPLLLAAVVALLGTEKTPPP